MTVVWYEIWWRRSYDHRLNLWRCFRRHNPGSTTEFISNIEKDAEKLCHHEIQLTSTEILIIGCIYACWTENYWQYPRETLLPKYTVVPELAPTCIPLEDPSFSIYLKRFPEIDKPLLQRCYSEVLSQHKNGTPVDYWLVSFLPIIFSKYVWRSMFDDTRLIAEPGSSAKYCLRFN